MSRTTVLGGGSWGTALGVHLARVGHDVRLWARNPVLAHTMQLDRVNEAYLPGITLPPGVHPTGSVEWALERAELVICTVPSHGIRSVCRSARPFVGRDAVVISATKGLETETLLRMSEVLVEELGGDRPVAVLSGPSFATEVARELPTAVSVACTDEAVAMQVQSKLRGPQLRLYVTTDVIGVELGGALKNVIAIAAGVVEGLQLGHNALAGLITRGLAEMTRLACAAGARRETLAGLTGLGDLVLTCTGRLSRNRHVGLELARGRRLQDILGEMTMVPEGVRTTEAALAMGARYGVELPIATQMAEVLAGRRPARSAVEELMLRRQRAETEMEGA